MPPKRNRRHLASLPEKKDKKHTTSAKSPTNKKKKSPTKTKDTINTINVPVPKVTPDVKQKYHVFVLNNGQKRYVKGENESDNFLEEYDDFIEEHKTFSSDKAARDFINSNENHTHKKKKETTVKSASRENLSPSDKDKLKRVKRIIERETPRPTICFDWKTTKHSHQVAVLIRPLGSDNKTPQWFLKTPFHRLLKGWFIENETEVSQINELFTNIALVKMRDPKKGPNDALTSPPTERNPKEYTQFVFWTHFTLPVRNLNSATQEQGFIEHLLVDAVRKLKVEAKSHVFKSAAEMTYTPKQWESMNNPTAYGGTWDYYFSTCRTATKRCDNLNTFVVMDDVKLIKNYLFSNELPEKKYPTDDLYPDQKLTKLSRQTAIKARNDTSDSVEEYSSSDDDDTKITAKSPRKTTNDDDDRKPAATSYHKTRASNNDMMDKNENIDNDTDEETSDNDNSDKDDINDHKAEDENDNSSSKSDSDDEPIANMKKKRTK